MAPRGSCPQELQLCEWHLHVSAKGRPPQDPLLLTDPTGQPTKGCLVQGQPGLWAGARPSCPVGRATSSQSHVLPFVVLPVLDGER